MVTPIDWKPDCGLQQSAQFSGRHHSMVTPIDWKLGCFVEMFRDSAELGE